MTRSHAEVALDRLPTQSAADRAEGDRPYQQIFETVGIGIARVNLAGYYFDVNSHFAQITGRTREALLGLHIDDVTHPDDQAATHAGLQSALDGQRDRYTIEKRYVQPDGQAVWGVLNMALLRDDQGRPKEFVAVVEDINERRRAQEAMASAQAAERASKAKTEFLSRMSHELRTPLNAMLGFAQLLRVDPRHPLADAQRQKVEHIEKAGAHLLAMMSDVLDLSRIEAGGLPMACESIAVPGIVDEAVAMVSNQAQTQQVSLLLTEPEPGLYVRGDALRLRQVLVNLLSNAIKYNHTGGRVQLECLPVDGHAVFNITDTGRGMNDDQLAHLFEPFNRLGAERTGIEGTGIGLVIVKRLVDLMQGRIEVSSAEGVGTSFRIWLPRTASPEERDSERRSGFGALDETGDRTLTVLYAEDNVVNVELVRQVMAMRPQWQLEVAYNGRDAIDQALSQPPDLLLLDMHLGDMTGLDVSDALAEHPATADIPRVALSADAMPDQIAQARARGFADYLTKPLDVGRFLKLLDRCRRGELI